MQIKVIEMKYILLWYIIGKKKSEKRVEKVESSSGVPTRFKSSTYTTIIANPVSDFS